MILQVILLIFSGKHSFVFVASHFFIFKDLSSRRFSAPEEWPQTKFILQREIEAAAFLRAAERSEQRACEVRRAASGFRPIGINGSVQKPATGPQFLSEFLRMSPRSSN